MPLSVAIAVASRDRPQSLATLLRALAQATPPEGALEVVIADTGAAASVRPPPDYPVPIRVLREPSGWRSRGLNAVLAAVQADLVIVFDDDTVPVPGAVRAYADAAGRYGPGWFFGGPHVGVDADQRPIPDPGPWREILPRSVRGLDLGADEVAVREPLFLGFNMAAFAADLRRAGGFPDYLGANPDTPLRGDETVLQQRMLGAGLAGVYLPGARVAHLVPPAHRTFAFALDRARQTGASRVLAEARETDPGRPPRPLVELARAAAAAARWATAAAAGRPAERRLRLRYDMHRDWGRVQAALRARRGRP
ncbi:MAG: glycosyltransferase [Hyphomicrobiales bacterium]|nr:glycosyltransferase [Hyphomicrobiales bacterium]MCP5370416.1 glycosyltransferase [Hyphomicrobiales bacterium]